MTVGTFAILWLVSFVQDGTPAPRPKSDPEAFAVIARSLERQGGIEAVRRAANLKTVGKLTPTGPRRPPIAIVIYSRADGARRVERRIGDRQQILACSGSDYWVTLFPELVADMPARVRAAFDRDRLLDQLLLRFVERGRVAKYEGETQEGDRTLVKVSFVPGQGSARAARDPIDLYFDTTTRLPHKIVYDVPSPTGDRSVRTTTVLEDYRVVTGVKLPHRHQIFVGDTLSCVLTVESYEVGGSLLDELFRRPRSS